MMRYEYSNADRKLIRKLADIAWERQLRAEIAKIGRVISEMASGDLSPFDANERVHDFHNGISRELYILYSGSDPWFAVCRAHFDGVLTDNDIAGASDKLRKGLQQFAERFRENLGFETSAGTQQDD
jgi:hypothetical protein